VKSKNNFQHLKSKKAE